jgi:hypothetical protein
MRHAVIAAVLAALGFGGSAASASGPRFCGRALAVMPSAQQHHDFLEQSSRYGPDSARDFDERVKRFGPDILDTQIIFDDSVGASSWFDSENFNGLREAKITTIASLSCKPSDYPLALMVGVKLKAILRGELLVIKNPGTYDIVSLRSLRSHKRIPVRHAASRKMLCRDIRSCSGLASQL